MIATETNEIVFEITIYLKFWQISEPDDADEPYVICPSR
jgi:hypothetical protein